MLTSTYLAPFFSIAMALRIRRIGNFFDCKVKLLLTPFSMALLLCSYIPLMAQQTAAPAMSPENDPQKAKRVELESQLTSATAKFIAGDFDATILGCEELLKDAMRTPQILLVRAQTYTLQSNCHYKSGRYLKAIDAAYLGTLEKSDYMPAHRSRTLAYLARKEFDKAINNSNRMIALDAKDGIAYSLRGAAFFGKNNFDQAISDHTKAIALNPTLADAFENRAKAYVAKKEMLKAIADLEQALKLQPSHPEALCDRGVLYATKRDYVNAVADFKAAMAVEPHLARPYLLQGRVLVAQELKEEARKCFDRAIEIQPDSETYLSRAQFLQESKKWDAAITDYTLAIAKDPKCLSAYQGRFACCKKLSNSEYLEIDQEKIRELSPKPQEKKGVKKKDDKLAIDPGMARRFIVKSKPVDEARQAEVAATAAKIDLLVESNHVKHQIKPNATTSDEQFVRRIYLDIVGRIPTLREVTGFLRSESRKKRTELIDTLLNSEGYASHQFNYWADTLRYKDELNNLVRGDAFRQYLKQSLAENKPWNKLVYEMLASQGRIWDTPATGYLQRDPGMPLDVMNNTLRIFMGTRIGCAQCHNHPFDRWTQKEFYHMAAFTYGTLNNTHSGEKKFFVQDPVLRLKKEFDEIEQEEEDKRNNTHRFDRMISNNMMVIHDEPSRAIRLPKSYHYDDAKPDEVVPPKSLLGKAIEIKIDEVPRKAFARWLVDKENPRFVKTIANRLWKQVFGIGQFEPVDDITDRTEAENPALMQLLESEMVRLNFDMKEFLRILVNTQAYQREAYHGDLLQGQPYHFPGPVLRRMTAEQAWDSFVTLAWERDDYRETNAVLKSKVLRFDFKSVTANDVINAESKGNEIDIMNNAFKAKYSFKGELIARASELPSPVPPNHFLRMFGQSDRELISASSKDGSVPQILFLLNGPISHMLLEQNSTIYNNIMKKTSMTEGVTSAFLTCLARMPDKQELDRGIDEVKSKGAAGYGNIVWSLVNTREFLFIQ